MQFSFRLFFVFSFVVLLFSSYVKTLACEFVLFVVSLYVMRVVSLASVLCFASVSSVLFVLFLFYGFGFRFRLLICSALTWVQNCLGWAFTPVALDLRFGCVLVAFGL